MSRNNASVSQDVTHLIKDATNLDAEELLRVHGITIEDDRTVFDTVTRVTYQTIAEWANETVEADYAESFESMQHGFHDDFY